MTGIDPVALVGFLILVPLAAIAAVGFAIAVCRGRRAERAGG